MGLMNLFGFGKGKSGGAKKAAVPLPKNPLGEVTGYYRKVNAAVIRVLRGTLVRGQEIWIKGHTTDLRMRADSLQIDRQAIEKAVKGQIIGIGVSKRVRQGDKVYLAADIESAMAEARRTAKADRKKNPAKKPSTKKKSPVSRPRRPAPKAKKKPSADRRPRR